MVISYNGTTTGIVYSCNKDTCELVWNNRKNVDYHFFPGN